ncbi:MAG: acetyltransferase [Desulfovibrionaceae bacterium]
MSKPHIVIGAGGHAKVLVDAMLLAGMEVLGLLDRDPGQAPKDVLGVPVLGDESLLQDHPPEDVDLVNAVGSVKTMNARREVFERLCGQGYEFAVIRHPGAVVSPHAKLLEGAQVLAGAVVGPGATIGENAIVNTGAVVDHDCDVGAHCHIAPGATLSGGVVVGEESHVGVGASVIQGVRLGRSCLAAAGAVVVRDALDGVTLMGVPARERES